MLQAIASLKPQRLRWSLVPLAVFWAFPVGDRVGAQVIPDRTLGAESSQLLIDGVTVDEAAADLIRAGARRGENVFHSFERFSVGAGQRVYFENPAGVTRVFSRVTGDVSSDIFGTLGSLGNADVFLLNPNGIVFGPNAQLDIAGSFTASTGDRFTFIDGRDFRAIPQENELLSISVPLGVQFNTQPQNQPHGNLVNEANLEVGPGQTLTLFGNSVSSTVHLAAPGGIAQVLGTRVELVDSETSELSESSGDTTLLVAAADGITIADAADNALLFARGTGQIVLWADADGNGKGDVVMLDLQDALQTNGRNLAISGINLTLGIIDASVQREVVGGEVIGVDTGGPIPDAVSGSELGTASFTFTVSAGGSNISDVDVRFSAEHTFAGDLSAELTSPNGTALPLFSDIGGSGNNFQDTILDDEASAPISAGSTPLNGRFQPEGDGGLAVFDGQLSEGTWTLTVTDDAPGDSGRLLQAGNRAPWGTAQGTQLIINASSVGGGPGGAVTLEALGNLSVAAVITTSSGIDSPSGAVEITAGGDITAARIDAGSSGNQGSDVVLLAGGNIQVDTPGIDASGGGHSGNGGQIQIAAEESITLVGSVDASAVSLLGDSGDGGAISVSSIFGDIEVSSPLTAESRADSSTVPSDSGDGGAISVSSTFGDITIDGSLETGSSSDALSGLDAVSGDSGDGGAITVSSRAGDITVNGDLSSSSISTSVSGLSMPSEAGAISGDSGDGGAIAISSRTGNVTVNGDLSSSSGSRTSTTSTSFSRGVSGDSGDGGPISISSGSGDIVISSGSEDIAIREGSLRSNSFSSSATSKPATSRPFSADLSAGNSGDGGSITLSSRAGDIVISGRRLDSNSFSISNVFPVNTNLASDLIDSSAGNSGDGGNITLSSRAGDISTDSDLSAFSFSNSGTAGNGGKISLAAIEGAIAGDETQVVTFSVAETGEITGFGGEVSFMSDTVSGLEIITLSSNGQSGDVDVRGFIETLRIRNLRTTTSGQVEIPNPFPVPNARTLTLDLDDFGQAGNTAIESASNIAFNNVEIQADANGSQPAGGVAITSPGQVTLTDSRINSNTNREGNAGAIRINADRLDINSSSIESSTGPRSTGQGGRITVIAGETALRNGGRITVSSAGQGQGGSVSLEGDLLTLADNSRISATTLSSDGGDLSFALSDLLLLQGGSEISTTAGAAEGGGDGGDISITTRFLTAGGNSDITANAFDGMGGNVDITASSGIFGIVPRRFRTTQSDITASSRNGVFGEIVIQSPEVDPDQSTVELPTTFAAPDLVQSCRETFVASGSQFIVTGRGGIPQSPLDPAAIAPWQDVLPIVGHEAVPNEIQSQAHDDQRPAVDSGRRSFSREARPAIVPVVEAQGWIKNEQGQIVLVAEAQPLASSSLPCEN